MIANNQLATDYERIELAIRYLEQNFLQQPSLAEIANGLGLSEYHFQRLFTRWAGISPKKFVQFLTLDYAKQLLIESRNLLEVTYEVGLSSPGRLHDLFITHEAMTPGEFKQKGAGLTLDYGFHPTPFGDCLLAATPRGICHLNFVSYTAREESLQNLQSQWPKATLRHQHEQTQGLIEQIFDNTQLSQTPLSLYLKGTNFQIKVWQALLTVPPGAVVSYETVAEAIGQPTAVRAVARALSQNPIGYLIPCHRVIHKIGTLGGYRWGTVRKKAMLGWEAAQRVTE